MKTEIAILGGGCFWCTEAVFKMLKGVISVEPGYAGGPSTRASTELSRTSSGQAKENPTYDEVSSGKTGHAEAIQIEFDPTEVSFRDLLTVFFGSHDPTTPNRQGHDVGTQYRSIILATNPEQEKTAKEFIEELNDSNEMGAPIVTEIKPLDKFYEAENYHKDYYQNNKDNTYCELVINPKLEKVQREFATLLKKHSNN
jgi:peptide-methionine (S)-S-oxide reductase